MKKIVVLVVLRVMMGLSTLMCAEAAEEGLIYDVKNALLAGVEATAEEPTGLCMKGVDRKNWGSIVFPDNGVRELEVSGVFNIEQAGDWFDWYPGGYFPMRFRYCTEEAGYDFGVILRHQNRGVFYRVMFSAKFNEVALWKEGEPGVKPETPLIPSGLYAVVEPHEIKTRRNYVFSVKAIGSRLQVKLDNKLLLDYADPVLPLEQGGWGFGVFRGACVRINDLRLNKARLEPSAAARKRPQFKVIQWHDLDDYVIFDGTEPVARLRYPAKVRVPWLMDIKLKPGYRALMSMTHVFENIHRESRLESVPKAAADGTSVSYTFGLSNQNVVGRGTVTVSYDTGRDTYCYTVDKSTTFKKAGNEYLYYGGLYFANTYYYNSMPTADESLPIDRHCLYTAASPYRMALVKGANGIPYRLPIQHFYQSWQKLEYGELPNYCHWWDAAGGLATNMYFVRYPAPVVCPAVEIVSVGPQGRPSEKPMLTPCCMYWDMHFSYIPHKNGQIVTNLNVGDTYCDIFRVVGYPRAAANKLFEKSRLAPFLNEKMECPWYVLGVNSFAKGGNVEQTAGGREIWMCKNGVIWDKTVGRGDNFSLRFENDAAVNEDLIGYNDDGVSCEKWEMAAWVKAEHWEGDGVRIGIRGLNSRDRWDVSEYFPIKTGEWQKVTYSGPYPMPWPKLADDSISLLYFVIQTKGKGVCWVDDVEFKKLK